MAHYRKLLCKDRIDAFDDFHNYGYEIPDLNIFHAINWTAQAWKNVSDNTIYRCWQRTGIIPEDDNMLIDAEEDIENTIQSLINQTDAAQLNAEDYININSSLEESDINDDETITLVQETAEKECNSNDGNSKSQEAFSRGL